VREGADVTPKKKPTPMQFTVPVAKDRMPEWLLDEWYLQAVEHLPSVKEIPPGSTVQRITDTVWITGIWDGVAPLRPWLLAMQQHFRLSDDDMREVRIAEPDMADYIPDRAKWPRFFGQQGCAVWPCTDRASLAGACAPNATKSPSRRSSRSRSRVADRAG
jgi:hypothetical protein